MRTREDLMVHAGALVEDICFVRPHQSAAEWGTWESRVRAHANLATCVQRKQKGNSKKGKVIKAGNKKKKQGVESKKL